MKELVVKPINVARVRFPESASYRVALNFCGSLILRIGDFFSFVGTKFRDWKLLGSNFSDFHEVTFK